MSVWFKNIEPELKGNVILFDLDGTLVETDYANFIAYKKSIEIVLGKSTNIIFDKNNRFDRATLSNHFPNLTDMQLINIIRLKNNIVKHYANTTMINKKVRHVLISNAKKGTNILVTNSNYDRAMSILEYYNLERYFKVVLCASHRKHMENKYQHAINVLSIDGKLVKVYENDSTQIQYAKQAGILERNIVKV